MAVLEGTMDQTMKPVATPQFMLDFFSSVDALDTPRFKRLLAADMHEVFGEQVVHGVDDIAKAFYALDADFVTKHNVTAVWQVGNAFVMHGSCDLTKKGAGPEATTHLAPLINVFWLNDQGKIASHVVTFPPAAKPAGYKG
jgi:hypothetical protein